MTHHAVILRSGRAIPVTVCGRIMIYEHPLVCSDFALRAMGVPYGHVNVFRRNDRRFRLMPRGWLPESEPSSETTPQARDRGGLSS